MNNSRHQPRTFSAALGRVKQVGLAGVLFFLAKGVIWLLLPLRAYVR